MHGAGAARTVLGARCCCVLRAVQDKEGWSAPSHVWRSEGVQEGESVPPYSQMSTMSEAI